MENDHLPTVIESLCMNCFKQGETRLLLTDIPFFRQVILSSFYCPECGYKSTDIQSGAPIQSHGCHWTLICKDRADLQRQIVKSEYATIKFEEIDMEIPPKIGKLTTIEGFLENALYELQETLKLVTNENETSKSLRDFLPKLVSVLAGHVLPLTLTIDDPSGNSFVENPFAPSKDPNLKVSHYLRNDEQTELLGLTKPSEEERQEAEKQIYVEQELTREAVGKSLVKGSTIQQESSQDFIVNKLQQENLRIPSPCPNCRWPGHADMALTDIPFFKEIVIFAFTCEKCGYRNNEVKGGGAIPKLGKRIILKIPSKAENAEEFESDMNRDVVKSTSAGLFIPELDLEVTSGSLGGKYTTIEGLLQLCYEKLFESSITEDFESLSFKFSKGDSAKKENIDKMDQFKKMFEKVKAGDIPFTFILDDPLDNSFIYSLSAPNPEPRLTYETYERSFEQNEELGLNDMHTDGYDQMIEGQPGDAGLDSAMNKMKDLQSSGKNAHPNIVGRPEGYLG